LGEVGHGRGRKIRIRPRDEQGCGSGGKRDELSSTALRTAIRFQYGQTKSRKEGQDDPRRRSTA
jgi:hypothetical protein